MSYKLAGEDDHVFKVQHPDGSEFHIAKSAIGPEVHKRIKSLEPVKMSNGADVKSPDYTLKDEELSSKDLESERPKESIEDPTASIKPDPNYDLNNQYQDFAKMNLNASPQELERHSQDLLLEHKQKEANAANSAALAEQNKAKEIAAQDAEYNKSAQTLGLPLRGMTSATTPTNVAAGVQNEVLPPQVPGGQSTPGIPSMNDAYAGLSPQQADYFKSMQAANDAMTKSAVNAGNANAASITQAQAKENEIHQKAQAEIAANEAEHKNIFDAAMNGKIDPNRMFSNMSTVGKIGSALSVLLSGAGSGLTGKPNMAMDVIQKNIDRDIEAQKMELGKTHTLLSDNIRRYGNIKDAERATTAQLWTGVNAMMQARAQQSGSAQAAALGQMHGAEIGLKSQALIRDMIGQRAESRSLGLGGNEGGIPVGQVPFQMLSNPKYQEKRVIVNGREYQHTGDKTAAQEYRNVESVAGGVTDLVHQLDDLGPSATIPGTAENNKAQALRYQLSTEIPKLKSMQIGAKRVNETEAERAEHMISDPTKFSQLINGGVRNDVFFKTLDDELERSRKDNLIGYKGTSGYGFKKGL